MSNYLAFGDIYVYPGREWKVNKFVGEVRTTDITIA